MGAPALIWQLSKIKEEEEEEEEEEGTAKVF